MNIGFYIDSYNKEIHDPIIRELEDVKNSVLFLNNPDNIDTTLPCFEAVYIWDFNDIIIADSFLSARYLLKCPNPAKKFLLCQELDWISNAKYQAIDKIKVYTEMTVLCKNSELKNIIENVWKIETKTLENIEDVKKML